MVESVSDFKKVYLVGIGGVGMSGLALLLHDQGLGVLGSDIKHSPQSDLLQKLGIEVFIGHRRENIPPDVDLFVYSSAVGQANLELQEARDRQIRIVKRGALLAALCRQKPTIAVAGSHGKTTTTSLMSYLFKASGLHPTVFVGGLPLNYTRGAWWGNDYFVIETDESDGSFLEFSPWLAILTNIDCEHLDYYKTEDNLRKSFLQFAQSTKRKVFGWGDELMLLDIVKKVDGISYGWGKHNTVRGANFYFDGTLSCFDLYIRGRYCTTVKIPLLGKHNCLNTLAVFAVLDYLGLDLSKANNALGDFKGTQRRFQIKERCNGVMFVDDYAHHPTEIRAVAAAARLLKPRRLFVVLQPHRFSRLQSLQKEFVSCFDEADIVIITDVYGASEKNISGISSQELFHEAKKHFSGTIEYIPKSDLSVKLPSYFQEGDMVLALGAGDINIVMDAVINEFKKYSLTQTG